MAPGNREVTLLVGVIPRYLRDDPGLARVVDQNAADEIFERLAEYPQCDTRWLETLAMMYAIRREWSKLKALAERLEHRTSGHNK